MPLSEYEQRQLAELERALTTVDPGYVRRFAALPASRAPRRWSRVRGVLCRLRWWRWPAVCARQASASDGNVQHDDRRRAGEELMTMMLFIVGVLLAGGAGAFTGLLIAYNTSGGPKYTAEMLGHSLPTLNTLGVFCSGVALGLIFCVGVWLLVAGARHTRHRLRRQGWVRRAARHRDISAGHPRRL